MRNRLFWQNEVLDQATNKKLRTIKVSKNTVKFTKLFEKNDLYRPLLHKILNKIEEEYNLSSSQLTPESRALNPSVCESIPEQQHYKLMVLFLWGWVTRR